jgi:hypothetical protein
VHVTELIRKPRRLDLSTPFPLEAYPSPPPEDSALETLLAPADHEPNSHRRPPSKGAQVAKIVSLGVASAALCASIAFGTMITHQRQEEGTSEAARPGMDISGEQALLPDLLNQAVPKAGFPQKPALPGATRATGAIENPGPPAPAGPERKPPAETGPGVASVQEPLSKKDFVEHFYRLIPAWPDRAFALLDGTLLGTDLGEFERSWSDVRDIQVEARDQGDNVLAIVRMRLPDGSQLLVQQLVYVTNSVPQLITGAQVLSAQRG